MFLLKKDHPYEGSFNDCSQTCGKVCSIGTLKSHQRVSFTCVMAKCQEEPLNIYRTFWLVDVIGNTHYLCLHDITKLHVIRFTEGPVSSRETSAALRQKMSAVLLREIRKADKINVLKAAFFAICHRSLMFCLNTQEKPV